MMARLLLLSLGITHSRSTECAAADGPIMDKVDESNYMIQSQREIVDWLDKSRGTSHDVPAAQSNNTNTTDFAQETTDGEGDDLGLEHDQDDVLESLASRLLADQAEAQGTESTTSRRRSKQNKWALHKVLKLHKSAIKKLRQVVASSTGTKLKTSTQSDVVMNLLKTAVKSETHYAKAIVHLIGPKGKKFFKKAKTAKTAATKAAKTAVTKVAKKKAVITAKKAATKAAKKAVTKVAKKKAHITVKKAATKVGKKSVKSASTVAGGKTISVSGMTIHVTKSR